MSNIPTPARSLRQPSANANATTHPPPSRIAAVWRAQNAGTKDDGFAGPSRLSTKRATTHARTNSVSTTATSRPSVSQSSQNVAKRPPSRFDSKHAARPQSLSHQTRTRTPDASSTGGLATVSPATRTLESAVSVSVIPSRHLRGNSVTSTLSTNTVLPPRHVRGASVASTITSSQRFNLLDQSMAQSRVTTDRNGATLSSVRPLSISSATMLRPPAQKPAFNTLQTHYSPAKSHAPKPASSTFLVPPTPSRRPENIAISADIAKMQAELLQLHILHHQSVERNVLVEWRESARSQLEHKFEVVRNLHTRAKQVARSDEQLKNDHLLQEWVIMSGLDEGLKQRISVLNEVLTGILTMGEQHSKHEKCVKAFDRWLRVVEAQMAVRKNEEDLTTLDDVENGALQSSWRDECERSVRKLHSWHDQMKVFGVITGDSSLGRVVRGCRDLVRNMLSEVQAMLRIDKQIQEQESAWISRMCDEDSDSEGEAGRGVGWAWKA